MINKPHLMAVILALLATSLSAQTVVLQDDVDWPGTTPGELNGNINANIPARQSGTTTTNYTATITNPVAGVTNALENASPALAGSPDSFFFRTVTGGTVGLAHQTTIAMDSNFTSLATNQWSVDYTARLNIGGAALADTYFGFGLGTASAPVSPAADGFFVAVRNNGDWLLWRNGATGFTSGTLSNFTEQQEYSVSILIDETGINPTLSIDVTPLGQSQENIASGLSLDAFGANRNFAFQTSAVSQNNGGFTDVRFTNIDMSIVPEPAHYGMIGGAMIVLLALFQRRIRK